jgi:hypothetical protein
MAMTVHVPLFYIDKANSDLDADIMDEGSIYVDVAGRCSVCVKVTKDGVSVDVYPLAVSEESLASCWVPIGDLIPGPERSEEEEEEEEEEERENGDDRSR